MPCVRPIGCICEGNGYCPNWRAPRALCQNGCGRVRLDQLVPDEADPPGLCPICSGQTCDCEACMGSSRYDDGSAIKDVEIAAQ